MLALHHRESLGHLFRFLIVGGIATVVNYLVFYLLLKEGTQYQIASACGFLAGVGVGFPLNKAWTYKHSSSVTAGLVYKYGAIYFVSLLINACTMQLLVGHFRLDTPIANVIAIIVTTITNFIGTKFWVFQK